MGTVYKETFTKPLPAGAKIIVRKGQRIARPTPGARRQAKAPKGYPARSTQVVRPLRRSQCLCGLHPSGINSKRSDGLAGALTRHEAERRGADWSKRHCTTGGDCPSKCSSWYRRFAQKKGLLTRTYRGGIGRGRLGLPNLALVPRRAWANALASYRRSILATTDAKAIAYVP